MSHELDENVGRWASLINARGIAGLGARETPEEKAIVEKSTMAVFEETLLAVKGVHLEKVTPECPPLPDFKAELQGREVRVELVEFIDADLIKTAKHIRSSTDHPLHKERLTFETNENWFQSLLLQTISKKEERYARRTEQVDVLLIWNEALELEVDHLGDWLAAFRIPVLSAIKSIYFQSWYHPTYVARPTWSLVSHPLIGEITPKKRGA